MRIVLDTNVLLISLPLKSKYRPIFDTLVANADHLVSEDRHFNILKDIDFPKLSVIRADDFLELVKLQ